MLKSREGKLPPAGYYAKVQKKWELAFGIRIAPADMARMKPYIDHAWREGKSAEVTAETTCSCDGKMIAPSPAVQVNLVQGEVRPPLGAERGAVFGAAEIRESGAIFRLRVQIASAQLKGKRAQERAEKAEAAEQRSRATTSKLAASRRVVEALQEVRRWREEIRGLEAQVHKLLAEQEAERKRLSDEIAAIYAASLPKPTTSAPAKRATKAAAADSTAKPTANKKPAGNPPAAASEPVSAKMASAVKRHNAENV